jgi:hypothetical protein
MPSQREQYGNTVHQFIGTGRSPCKITLMSFTFINNSIVILQGLIWLFIFKSVPFSRRYVEALLQSVPFSRRYCRSSSAHSFVIVLSFAVIAIPVKLRLNHALVYSQSDFEGICSHISLGKQSNYIFEDLRKPKAPNSRPRLEGIHGLWVKLYHLCRV